MKIHPGEQGTPEWDELRRGKITASVAAKMITGKGAISTQAKQFVGKLMAEFLGLQEPEPLPVTFWMERGIEMESQARGFFQVETGLHVERAAFIESGDGLSGFSPDGFIKIKKDIIPLELKCPKPSTHIGYILEGKLPYKQQCHFAMAITGAPYMFFMSYHPDLPEFLLKVRRDDYTETLCSALEVFKNNMAKAREIIEQ